MIKQIYFLTLFIFSIYSYAYVLVTPAILLHLSPLTIKYIKILSQSFIKFMFINGFKCNFYQSQTEQKIKELFRGTKDKIDIIISNHISTIDFFIIHCILKQYKVFNMFSIIDPKVKYDAGFGLIMYLGSGIEVNINWQLDKNIIEPQLDDIKLDNKSKYVILIFPEGTRMKEDKLLIAQKFSKDNNIHRYENLLVPKIKGIWTMINHLTKTNRLGNVWDISVIIPKYLKKKADLVDLIKKNIGNIFIHMRTVSIKANYNYDEFKENFYNFWKEKDDLITNYKSFHYNEIDFNDKKTYTLNNVVLIVILLFGIYLLTKKSGRYYLLISFILSYVFIKLNIKKIL
jgi:lysocardiolipin and lysophospholipid acyltransferase